MCVTCDGCTPEESVEASIQAKKEERTRHRTKKSLQARPKAKRSKGESQKRQDSYLVASIAARCVTTRAYCSCCGREMNSALLWKAQIDSSKIASDEGWIYLQTCSQTECTLAGIDLPAGSFLQLSSKLRSWRS